MLSSWIPRGLVSIATSNVWACPLLCKHPSTVSCPRKAFWANWPGIKASLVAQLVKNPPAMRETWIQPLGWEEPWRRESQPITVFWPREFHGLVQGVSRSQTRLSDFHFHFWKKTQGDCIDQVQFSRSVMSDSMRPHIWQLTRLPRPWDSPGQNTGVGCHFLLQCMKVKSESEVAQSCPTLSNPMDYSLPGSSIHGIFQARVLEWGATGRYLMLECMSF